MPAGTPVDQMKRVAYALLGAIDLVVQSDRHSRSSVPAQGYRKDRKPSALLYSLKAENRRISTTLNDSRLYVLHIWALVTRAVGSCVELVLFGMVGSGHVDVEVNDVKSGLE